MDPLRAVRDPEAVRDAETRVPRNLPPCEPVRADIEPAPALGVADEAGHRHRALEHWRQGIADVHFREPPGLRAPRPLLGVPAEDLVELLRGVVPLPALPNPVVLGPLLAGGVTLGAETPAIRSAEEVPLPVVEVNVVDLLHRTPREAGLVEDEVLQPRLGMDLRVPGHRPMPPPIRPCPHRVNAREPPDVSGDDAAAREEERRGRDHVAVAGGPRVGPGRTRAGCRRRCRARSAGCCRGSPRGTRARGSPGSGPRSVAGARRAPPR